MGNVIPPSSGGYPDPIRPITPAAPARKVGPEDTPDEPEQREDGKAASEAAAATREEIGDILGYDAQGKPIRRPPPPTVEIDA